jgi:Mg2+ and Co2+ transporter CorA
MRRPTLADPSIGDIGPHPTNRTALIRHQKERLSSAAFRKLARSDCFFVLGDLYQLAASNWIVINEYILREMTAIEYKLERNEDDFQDLEFYLKELYVHRRRITRYQELIKETKEQCSGRGPRAWPRNEMSEIAAEQAQDWGNDFSSLHVWFYDTSQRIEKNIRLLTALVAITEGKQSLVENHGIARLSLLAMVFLPFSSVATILGMQGSFAPGDRKFWLFWVVGIALTTFVVGLFLLYDRLAQFVRRLKFSAAAKRRDERKSRGVIPDEEHKLPSVYH